MCVISGGYGTLLRARLEKLGVTKIYLGCMNKIEAMEEFFREYDIDPAYTIYMGDDIPGAPRCMDKVTLMEVNNAFHDRLIYTFDMMNNRSFYLELLDMQRPQDGLTYPRVAFEHAPAPDQYDPEATEEAGSIFDEMMSDYNEFDGDDSYDDEY